MNCHSDDFKETVSKALKRTRRIGCSSYEETIYSQEKEIDCYRHKLFLLESELSNIYQKPFYNRYIKLLESALDIAVCNICFNMDKDGYFKIIKEKILREAEDNLDDK